MRDRFNFFEPDDTPPKIHVGLRMVKTVAAVYLCSIIGYFTGEAAFFAMFAAILCIQNNTEKSLLTALNRMLGTIIGGFFGVLICHGGDITGLNRLLPLYYLVVSLLLIPVMLSTLLIKKPSISAFTCIVYISVALTAGDNLIQSAVQRITETLIGIVIALIINLVLPKRQLGIKEQTEAPEPQPCAGCESRGECTQHDDDGKST